MKIEDFEGKGPAFTPEDYFAGRLEGWGVMESPLGGLQKRYTVRAEGRLEGGVIHFTETWTFDDGHVDTLNWTIRPLGGGRYAGSESRIDGEAEGERAGFAFRWKYARETPQPDGKSIKLNFDDWFWRIDERVVVVKGTAGRLGLPFATAHVTYRKLD
jgi:hypothetical protein